MANLFLHDHILLTFLKDFILIRVEDQLRSIAGSQHDEMALILLQVRSEYSTDKVKRTEFFGKLDLARNELVFFVTVIVRSNLQSPHHEGTLASNGNELETSLNMLIDNDLVGGGTPDDG